MFLFKFALLLVFSCTLQSGSRASYVYPLWGEQKLDKSTDPSDGDATVTEFIIANFLIPMRDVFCNVCTNFLEVYTCIVENVGHFGEKTTEQSQSYLDKTLNLFGLRDQHQSAPRSCSYYSILVVTVSIVMFVSLLFITKKLVEYMKEEDRVFPHILTDYKSKCPCYQEKE